MAARKSIDAIKKRAARVSATLAKLYPEARISLDFETAWQCLAATILSAQCTDERVNLVTPALFREFPDARAMADADTARVEQLILTTGFFRQKTKSLMTSAKMIVERHGGEVPSEMDHLVKLSGVGRKTANVILGHVHGKPGFVVDTHVRRLTMRLGFTKSSEPTEIEEHMQKILPPADWTPFSMRLILHGRQVCHARQPRCADCEIVQDCPQIGVVNKAAKSTNKTGRVAKKARAMR